MPAVAADGSPALPATPLPPPFVDQPVPPVDGARRIVSLAPSVTETIFALGAEDRLVAVSDQCEIPPGARELPRAGSYLEPSVETILSLRPGVVLGVPTPSNRVAVERLRTLGVPVAMVGEATLEDAWRAMIEVGRWVGREPEARTLVERLRREIEEVRVRSAHRGARRVLFVVGHDPLLVVGEGTFLDELLRATGATNVAAGAGQRWPRLSLEAVVAGAPDVILDGAMGSEGGSALFAWWKSFESLPAVREKRIRPVRSASLLRPGPHLGESAREIETLVWEGTLPFVPPARESTAAVPSAAGGGHGAGAP